MTIGIDFISNSHIILITGASGSGKTTALHSINEILPSLISLHHFDDIGVPTVKEMIKEYGTVERWQEEITHRWIERLSKIRNKKLVFLEGSFNPEFAVSHLKKLKIRNYSLICLYTKKSIRDKRLIIHRNQPDLATQEMENFSNLLKEKTLNLKGTVLSSEGSPSEIARTIIKLIFSERCS
ncbi:AAA family ATPase [Alphaproteobacteria bacterium]|nr:AAA family ATPase [Alphaproteobacteria bacterium]